MELTAVLKAANFAAVKHRDQRRKDSQRTPYINHPIGVANILTEEGWLNSCQYHEHNSWSCHLERRSNRLVFHYDWSSIMPIFVQDYEYFLSKKWEAISGKQGSIKVGRFKKAPSRNLTFFLAGITDPIVLQAALLHDTVEDTKTTFEELEENFGKTVREYVWIKKKIICLFENSQ